MRASSLFGLSASCLLETSQIGHRRDCSRPQAGLPDWYSVRKESAHERSLRACRSALAGRREAAGSRSCRRNVRDDPGERDLLPQLRLFPALIETVFLAGAAMPHISRIALVFAFVLSLFASPPQRAAAETSELMKAIEANDVRWVRALIAAGANVKNDVRHLRDAVIRGYVPI